MNIKIKRRFISVYSSTFIFIVLLLSYSINAEPLRVAVSANFHPVLSKLLPQFHQQNIIVNNAYANQPIELISGASGVLYQQIRYGAPFDIFLSADALRPQQLVKLNKAKATSLTTYAIGQLSLWSPSKSLTLSDIDIVNQNVNLNYKFNNETPPRLAIANPNTAPYGQAAKQVLINLNVWQQHQHNVITGMNINQTFQQVRSHSAAWGIVATSQLSLNKLDNGLIIPHELYSPIQQQGVILARSKKNDYAQHFMKFLMSETIQKQLYDYGYLSVKYNKSAITKVNDDSL